MRRSKITTARSLCRQVKRSAAIMVIGLAVVGLSLLAADCGGSASPSQDPTAQLNKFAACMRSHGVPNFPAPRVASHEAKHSVGLSIPDSMSNWPQYQMAFHTCEEFAPTGFFPAARAP